MQPAHNPNQLIVEGADDLHSVVGLMQAHVDWPDGGPTTAPVYIKIGNGAEEILRKEGVLNVLLKSPTVRIAGVVLDADQKLKSRYDALRNISIHKFPNMPLTLPEGGLVIENKDGLKLGIWIMPDNQSDGTLETFLKVLVPPEAANAWEHAKNSVTRSKELGCGFRDGAREKAELYTWLAWQDPPGQSPGIALTKRVLDPTSASAEAFVTWFRRLFDLPPKQSLFS